MIETKQQVAFQKQKRVNIKEDNYRLFEIIRAETTYNPD